MEGKKTKLIFSHNMCKYLLFRGFNIVDVIYNKQDNVSTVFVFPYSTDLENCIKEYKTGQRKSE